MTYIFELHERSTKLGHAQLLSTYTGKEGRRGARKVARDLNTRHAEGTVVVRWIP